MGHSLNNKRLNINQNLVIDDKTFNPGYILVSDEKGNASWQSPSKYIDSQEPLDHYIGELWGGGIVVAVWREVIDQVYEKVLIASVKDYGEQQPPSNNSKFSWIWSPASPFATGASYRSFGASNSRIIDSAVGWNAEANRVCLNYVNEDLGGLGVYYDWYLPSAFELNCLANNAGLVNRVIESYAASNGIRLYDTMVSGTTMSASMSLFGRETPRAYIDGKGYWSSTETNASQALYLDTQTLRFSTATKSLNNFNVRPFRQDVKRWNGTTWVKDRRNTGVVLIVSDGVLFTNLPEYYNGVITNLTAAESSQGNTVQIITSYSSVPNDLSMYDHIWDIDVSQPNISANTAKYTTYLQQGGGLFLLGENTAFAPVRDTNIANFITTLGGGSVTFDTSFPSPNPGTCSVETEFLIANNTNTIIFGACGRFSSIGTGTTITRMSAPVGNYPIGTPNNVVIWKTGNLSLAPKGAIVVALDINFISDYAGGDTFGKYTNPPYNGRDFTANISQILNKS